MKMCQSHWDALKSAVESRGLGHLIAANSRDAFARAVADLKGTSTPDDFDPLMTAHWMIQSACLEAMGLALFAGDSEEVHVCPLCETLKVYPPIPEGHRYASNESYFIDGPADSVLEMAKTAGLWPATSDPIAAHPGETRDGGV